MIEFYIFAHFKLRKQQLFTNSPPQSFVHQFEKISFLSAFEIKITVISSGNIYPANLKVIKIQKTILESSSLVVSSQKIKKPNKNDVKIAPWPRKFRSHSIEYMEIKIFTMSETQYDWRKIEQVTMKANVIQFWCVESEFIVKI